MGWEKKNVVELLPLSGGKPNWERTGMSLSGMGFSTNPNSGRQNTCSNQGQLVLILDKVFPVLDF